jgi:hypothetical protein
MKSIFCSAAASLLLLSGCATPGLRFEILQPPVLMGTSNAVVQSTSGSMTAQSTGMIAGPLAQHQIYVEPSSNPVLLGAPRVVSGRPPLAMPSAPDCNLEDVCRRLEALEKRLSK